jgi:4-hydroxy-3-methylbut-2-enyl diphosphate reductase
MKYPGGRYLVVPNMAEARAVCDFIEHGGDPAPLAERFGRAVSADFDLDRDLTKVGLANQTTMLSGESLAIADEFRKSMERRYGAAALAEHFRTFDTICSATQERQDAVLKLMEEPLDLMVVVGGYNSSNTCHLAALVHSKGVRTFHIEDADGVDPAAATIRHQPVGTKREQVDAGWLGAERLIGITAGASTPNNKVGETIARICRTAGLEEELKALTT